MSKAMKGAEAPAPAEEPLPFEAALQKLEALVESMESEELPLETLLGRFEEGARLIQACQAKLAAAEAKLQQLEKRATGELGLKPLATPEAATEG